MIPVGPNPPLQRPRRKRRAAERLVGDWKYDSVRQLRRNAIVTPLAAPGARIRVATLLT